MDLLSSLAQHDRQPHNTCSRRGCQQAARWQIVWNNPKIHAPDRQKIWLACHDHRDYLQDFLGARKFWKETRPFSYDQ